MDIRFKTKSNMVYHYVREDIIRGVLKPGERLRISVVAKQYGVSEIPVREAFQLLMQERFLNSRPNAGFVVSQISEQDVRDIFQVRLELEALAAREAANRMSSADVDALEQMIDRMESYIAERDYNAYWVDNRKWHLALYQHCDNEVLMHMLRELYDYSCRYPAYYTKLQELQNSIAEHRQIIDALRRRNAPLAEAYIRSHTIETSCHYIGRVGEMLGDGVSEQANEQ